MQQPIEGKHFAAEQARVEVYLIYLLRAGSTLAALLIAVGLALLTLGSAAVGHGLVTAGLIVLVLTPVARVLVAMLAFLKERDYVFAGICAVVLFAVTLGVLLGRTH